MGGQKTTTNFLCLGQNILVCEYDTATPPVALLCTLWAHWRQQQRTQDLRVRVRGTASGGRHPGPGGPGRLGLSRDSRPNQPLAGPLLTRSESTSSGGQCLPAAAAPGDQGINVRGRLLRKS